MGVISDPLSGDQPGNVVGPLFGPASPRPRVGEMAEFVADQSDQIFSWQQEGSLDHHDFAGIQVRVREITASTRLSGRAWGRHDNQPDHTDARNQSSEPTSFTHEQRLNGFP